MSSKKLLLLAFSLSQAFARDPVPVPPPAPTPQSECSDLLKLAPSLSPHAIEAALVSLTRLQESRAGVQKDVLAIIDYTKPSTERRFWVFDLVHRRVLFHEFAAHGKNSGERMAVKFSNVPNSLMSSIGALLTADTYIGKHGLSLRLQGLERGINDNCRARDIVIHAAEYVSEQMVRAKGLIGRSWGCPAVRREISKSLIETLRGGVLLLAYYPDPTWLRTSQLAGPLNEGRPRS